MKTKITQSIPALLTLLVVGFSQFSLWCSDLGNLCYRTWIDSIFLDVINPLYFFSLYFLPIAIILIFVPRHVFNSWLKLAVWALPLAFIFIATTDVSWSGIGINFFPFYRDDAARLSAEIFTSLSILLVVWKLIANRQSK
ncbi:MAG: hypothetical protein WAW90_00955 [Minisyncoccia bacterium]